MKILIVGVSGFIGNYLYHALDRSGHYVLGVSRQQISGINWREFSFAQSQHDWMCLLKDIDLVINATGIYQQTDEQSFAQIHNVGPVELFIACEKNNIRVIQISAIGAEKNNPVNDFLQSKRIADQYLLKSNLPHRVLYPGIVLGEGGATTWQLSHLLQLPCVPVVLARKTRLPLISIYQLTEHIMAIVEQSSEKSPEKSPEKNPVKCPEQICNKAMAEIVLAESETIDDFIKNMRDWLHNKQTTGETNSCLIYLPQVLLRWGFIIFPRLSIGLFNKQSSAMLDDYTAGNYPSTVNQTASASLLEHKVTANYLKNIQYNYLYYFNLITLSMIWIVSGISSLANFQQSRELIGGSGLSQVFGDQLIITAAIIDILLGISMWLVRIRTRVIYLQIGVMLVYSLLVAVIIPIYWLHPFSPMLKNLAMLVLAFYLVVEKKEI